MDSKKILEVVAIYRRIFEISDISKIDFPHDRFLAPRHNDDALAHCHGMLDKIEGFVAQGRLEKTFRWLGFVQGVLWSTGVCSLENLKNHDRPDIAG